MNLYKWNLNLIVLCYTCMIKTKWILRELSCLNWTNISSIWKQSKSKVVMRWSQRAEPTCEYVIDRALLRALAQGD